jgi:ribokinase
MIWFSLAVALAEGRPLLEAARFANAAAAISVARFGAQSSIPFREEIDDFVARQGKFTPANRMRA